MRTRVFFVLFFLFPVVSRAQEYYVENAFRYDDHVYDSLIYTVLLHKEGWELSYPFIKKNSGEKLLLSFDDLSPEYIPRDFYYTLIHCNAVWEPSGLSFSEYCSGMEYNPIREYEFSRNTWQPYIHYHLSLPNDDCRPLLSGNYLLVVCEGEADGKPVLTRRFYIADEKVRIAATVRPATLPSERMRSHEIDFTITVPSDFNQPSENIRVVLMQNFRYDNAIWGLKPKYVNGFNLIYDYEEENLFRAGNQFRHFDLKSERYASDRTDSIFYADRRFHFQLRDDADRSFMPFAAQGDINGMRLIEREGSSNSATEADYFYTHFSLPFPAPLIHGNLYVQGMFTDWKLSRANMLKYNYERQRYELTMLLKQGYYNYEYVLLEDHKPRADETYLEGSYIEAENQYYILVYYAAPNKWYEELAGIVSVSSAK